MMTTSFDPAALATKLPAQTTQPAQTQDPGSSFERELQRANDAAPRARDEDVAHDDARREPGRTTNRRDHVDRRGHDNAGASAGETSDAKKAADAKKATDTKKTADSADPTKAIASADDNTPVELAANDDSAAAATPDLAAFVASLGVRPDALVLPQARAGAPIAGDDLDKELPVDPHGATPDIRAAKAHGAPMVATAAMAATHTRPDVAQDTPRVLPAEFQAILRAATPAGTEIRRDDHTLGAGAALALASGGAPAPGMHSAARPAEATLASTVGSREFAQALGAQLTTFAQDGIEHARLKVHPADLGPITVKLTMDGTQVRVDFAADAGATRQALEQALPSLAAALRDAGLTLSGGGVFQQPRNGTNGGNADTGNADQRGSEGDLALGADEIVPLRSRTVRLDGLIDLYA